MIYHWRKLSPRGVAHALRASDAARSVCGVVMPSVTLTPLNDGEPWRCRRCLAGARVDARLEGRTDA